MFVPLECYRSVVPPPPSPSSRVSYLINIDRRVHFVRMSHPLSSCFSPPLLSLVTLAHVGIVDFCVYTLYRSSPGGRHWAYCCWLLQVSFKTVTLVLLPATCGVLCSLLSPCSRLSFGFLVSKTGTGMLVECAPWSTGCVLLSVCCIT